MAERDKSHVIGVFQNLKVFVLNNMVVGSLPRSFIEFKSVRILVEAQQKNQDLSPPLVDKIVCTFKKKDRLIPYNIPTRDKL